MCALKRSALALAGLVLLALEPSQAVAAASDDLAARSADYAAVERVYYDHRLGNKLPFEKVLPPAAVQKAVRAQLKKEAVFRRVYGVTITPAQIDAEVKRIDSTTRAPEMLAEIKAALGNDAVRFARAVARPIIVERELRARFANDDKLHAPQRREAGQAREAALAAGKDGVGKQIAALSANKAGAVTEATWQLTSRPEVGKSEISALPPQTKGVAKSGAYSVEATAQIAQVLKPPNGERDRKFYFEDLEPELQKVLRVQLQKAGDVSAVIEMPTGFLIFQAKAKTSDALTTASLSIPKRSYEEWLAQQPE